MKKDILQLIIQKHKDHEEIYVIKLEKLEEMDKLLDKYNLSKSKHNQAPKVHTSNPSCL
jgi:hypothetical protein